MACQTFTHASDINQVAALVVAKATGTEEPTADEGRREGPAAVALGRKGGLRGGKARAEKMTREQRSEAARKADCWPVVKP